MFATREAPELSPLSDVTPVSLLPVAGKPLLMHAIESLAMAGLTDLIIVVGARGDVIRRALGNGGRFGLRCDYFDAGRTEPLDSVITRLGPALAGEYLIVRGEILRSPVVGEFLSRARALEAPVVAASINNTAAGLWLIRQNSPKWLGLPDQPSGPRPWRERFPAINFPRARLSRLESLSAYHRANLDAAAGLFKGLILPGYEWLPDVLIGRNVSISRAALKGRGIFVGSGSRIAADAELRSEVVISEQVLIDRGASLRSAVILPHTYIGRMVEVANAIVAGNTLIHLDPNAITRVRDSFLLAPIANNSGPRV